MKASPKLVARAEQPAQRRILEGLRSQIMSGSLAPGTQLPSARALATAWQSNSFTVHLSLSALAKEGWLERRPGSGTYIADPKNRFSCAGIYHDSDIASNEQRAFIRSLHFSLLKGFERLKKDTQVFIDSRPPNEQQKMLPALADAIRQRRIQCLVAPTINEFNLPSLARLTMPFAYNASSLNFRCVDYDMDAMLRESVRQLAAQGCRSIGLIGNFGECPDAFIQAARDHGLALHMGSKEMSASPVFHGVEAHGYHEFKRLWNLRHKPDGLLVFPDVVVHGVILAILEAGVGVVTQHMKFVFHRNAHVPLLCPFPVTWAIADENALAEGMIQSIQKQFRREKAALILVPHVFKDEITLK